MRDGRTGVRGHDLPECPAVERAKGFVWVCRRRAVAYELAAACEGAGAGHTTISPRAPRPAGGWWIGPRWIVHCRGVSGRERHALQRLAARLDPSAWGRTWNESEEKYE